MTRNLFSDGAQLSLLGGECDCADCLMRKMLDRSPSELLFRARVHLGSADAPRAESDHAAVTLLRFLECKTEAST